jgi:hypothetical protein
MIAYDTCADSLFAARLGPVGGRGRVLGDAESRDVQEPDHAGGRGEPSNPCCSLEMNLLEALPALAADADEVDHGLGVSDGGANLVLAAKISDDGLEASVYVTNRAFRLPGGDADGPAVLRQARRQ